MSMQDSYDVDPVQRSRFAHFKRVRAALRESSEDTAFGDNAPLEPTMVRPFSDHCWVHMARSQRRR